MRSSQTPLTTLLRAQTLVGAEKKTNESKLRLTPDGRFRICGFQSVQKYIFIYLYYPYRYESRLS